MGTLFSAESRKAWLAFAIALIGSLAVGAQDGVLVLFEYLTAASAALVALGGVYGIPNGGQK
jgi:hypothetical protein